MEPEPSFSTIGLVFLVFAGFLILFPLIWGSVLWLLSRISGWDNLARSYPAGDRPVTGEKQRRLFGLIGASSYRGVLTTTLNEEGFFLEVSPPFRIGHPRLFIPWSAVTSRTPHRVRWMSEGERITIGSPVIATLSLPRRALEGYPKPPPIPGGRGKR